MIMWYEGISPEHYDGVCNLLPVPLSLDSRHLRGV